MYVDAKNGNQVGREGRYTLCTQGSFIQDANWEKEMKGWGDFWYGLAAREANSTQETNTIRATGQKASIALREEFASCIEDPRYAPHIHIAVSGRDISR